MPIDHGQACPKNKGPKGWDGEMESPLLLVGFNTVQICNGATSVLGKQGWCVGKSVQVCLLLTCLVTVWHLELPLCLTWTFFLFFF
jgi:hypothetical protein